MPDATRRDETLALDLQEAIDQICDRFEARWKSAQRPSIEAFIPSSQGHLRRALLGELLALELEYRSRLGEKPAIEEYEARFPDDLALVRLTFESASTHRPPKPAPLAAETVGWNGAPDGPAGTDCPPAATRFSIIRPHAQGGLGSVSIARDEELNREVALKEIHKRHANDPDSRARFLREAEITGRLEHPSIVPVYGLGQYADGRPFYAMRFIRGDSLKEAIESYHQLRAQKTDPDQLTLELRKLLARFLDVCNAIFYAHSRGVLHRDLKPSNIMLGTYGETLVVDWGLAKALDQPELEAVVDEELLKPASGSGSTPTQMGTAMGTPQYMSPEQAAGRWDLMGPATDVYGLGATLYSILTGRPPFEGERARAIVQQVQRGNFPPPRAVDGQIARPLEAICLRAMALEPEDRYSSPRALADDLERWLADEPVTAYREPWPTRVARWGRKHKVLVAGAFGLMTAAAVALAVSNALIKQEQQQTDQARRRADSSAAAAEENAAIAEKNSAAAKENAVTAEKNAREALAQKENAEGLRKDAQLQLVLSYTDGGINELEHGEPARGMAVLGQAYRAAIGANQAELRHSVCALLGAWQSTCEYRLPTASRVVRAVAFSPDGSQLATVSLAVGSMDNTLQRWEAATGQPVGPPTNLGPTDKIAFSPDCAKLIATRQDKTARLWEMRTGQPFGPPLRHSESEGRIILLVFSPDGTKLATATGGATVRLWDTATAQLLSELAIEGTAAGVTDVAFSPDGAKLATVGWNGMGSVVQLWDAAQGQSVDSPMTHAVRVVAAAFSPDGTRLATASQDKTARVWDVKTGQALGSVIQHDANIVRMAFSPDGMKLATECADNLARLWDGATGQLLAGPMKHSGNVAVVFSPDCTRLATGSGHKTVQLWDAATGRPLGAPMKHDNLVTATAFSPDGAKLAVATEAETRLWDGATARSIAQPTTQNQGVGLATFGTAKAHLLGASVAFGAGGAKVATVNMDNIVQLWDAATGQPFGLATDFGQADQAVLSADGTKFATANVDNAVRLWDVATGQPLGQPLASQSSVQAQAMIFSPDGTKFVTAEGIEARLWEVATGQPLGEPLRAGLPVQAMAFSPDGAKFATAAGGEARVWDATTGQPLGQPMENRSILRALALSPDGRKLAAGDLSGKAQLWDVLTGQRLGQPMKHDDEVLAVAFSPDGTKLATASRDNTARLWDAATGWPLGPPLKHGEAVLTLAFSPEGTRLVTVSSDNTARLWPVPTSLPDDPAWMAACLNIISGYQEDAAGVLQKAFASPMDAAWREVSRLPAWLDQRRADAARFARGWHELEAGADEVANRWFAAAFHLRWLCRLEPDNARWRERLANATQRLAASASPAPPPQPLDVQLAP